MLRWMYGVLPRELVRLHRHPLDRPPGTIVPITIEMNPHRPTAMIGNTQPLRQMFTMNRPGRRDRDQHQETQRRQLRVHVGVGRAVDKAAVRKRQRELRQVVLRTVFVSAISASSTERCTFTWGVTRWNGLCKRMPPFR